MTDLNDIFCKPKNLNEPEIKGTFDPLESAIGKVASEIFRNNSEQSNSEDHLKMLDAQYIQPNPIEETNKKLGSLHSTLKEESSKNSASTNIWNKKMFFISFFALLISIIALIVSAVFSILSYNSSNQSSAKLEQLILEQNLLIKTSFIPQMSDKKSTVK